MGLFKRKPEVIDLGERFRRQQEAKDKISSSQDSPSVSDGAATPFAFFDSSSYSQNSSSQNSGSDDGFLDLSADAGEKRKKLAKRILDMTTRMEDLSNQIYHLQQRIEVIERKLDLNRF